MPKLNLKKLNPFSGMGAKDVLGIDIGANNFKLLHMKTLPYKKEIVNVINRDIAGLSDIEISKAIRNSVAELDTRAQRVIDVIPSNLVITKNIEIPSINPQEIKEIISLQAGIRLIPARKS